MVVAALTAVAALGAAGYWLTTRGVPVPDSGVPIDLARDRATRITKLEYFLTVDVPESRTQPVRARVVARFELSDASRPLALDFSPGDDQLASATANGEPFDGTIQNGHLIIPSSRLIEGENNIDVDVVAGDAPLNRQDDLLYTLFVPARASATFPCFDQPDLKGVWRVTLMLPAGWASVSNGPIEREETLDTGRRMVVFDATEPLPTYLVAFAAGQFREEREERNGRTFRMLHRETDPARIARNRAAIFDQHAQAIGWLEEYTGVRFPFRKFDFVLVPAFQFSGMEHPGAVYYNANSLLLDDTATEQQALNRANVIAHETAHMWFGNLVTMSWFNDVWMKEVFANFMAAKIVNPSFPSMNHDLRFVLQHLPAAYDVDRTAGANPIRQPLANLNEAGSLYGAIIYQKAPVVMRQLELLVGDDAFRSGIREYLDAHRFGNADWTDLVRRLDERTPSDLGAWSRAWVDEPGRPTIRTDLQVEKGVITRLALVQEDPRNRSILWPERLRLLVHAGGRIHPFDVTLEGRETVVPGAEGLAAPQWVIPDGLGTGYGFFDVDATTLSFLSKRVHAIPDPLTRGVALVILWEAMLEGRVPPADVLRVLAAAAPVETTELNLQQILDYTRLAFWRFTPADDREAAAKTLEPTLRTGLARASSTSAKASWFGAIRSIAITTGTLQWLEQVWRRDIRIPGLPLSEIDEADLAADLALREVPTTAAILATQLQRLENPDRKARFQFVMPALSPDAAERDRLFESLRDVRHRSREAWVLDAARYLHHPLRAPASRKHVRPALGLVREIQRTGDIFFPKRWADATLSGYQSVQTAAEVRSFIDALPADYPPRLRWVLLASADPLFRAARFQQQEQNAASGPKP
jgi:aminopeptidase N